MSVTGLAVFDKSLQGTNLWLKRTMDYLETDDRHLAYVTLRAVLHALRDRIGPDSAANLGAQLRMLLRGLYYEGWSPSKAQSKERHKQPFFDYVAAELSPGQKLDTEDAVKCVFTVIWEKVDPGEVSKLINMFPMEMRDLWPLSPQEAE